MVKSRTREAKLHMQAVKELPCCVCNAAAPSDCHHAMGLEFGCGMGKKSSDFSTMPLCKAHHQNGADAFHVLNKRAWEAKFGYQKDFVKATILEIYGDSFNPEDTDLF